jgi:2-hydroxy-3-keto-5-methylthiopentenyl-1-phosphate phosphatase
MLFVKSKQGGENDLAKYCENEKIPHVLFSDFSNALVAVRSVVAGEKTAQYWFERGRVED